MANKKKKTSPILMPLILVCAIAVLFLVYKVMDAQNQKNLAGNAAASETDVTMILEKAVEDVTAVGYTWNGEKNSFTWNGRTGLWELDGAKNFPLQQEPITTMANALAAIGVFRTLEDGDSGLYGFDSPEAEVTISFKDGETRRFAIGDLNTVSGNRYFKDLDSGAVHTIAAALLPYFQYTREDLFSYASLPTDIEASYIDSVTLSLNGKEQKITDTEKTKSFYTKFQLLTPTEYADWSGSDDALTKYGIGEGSLTVSYKKAVTVTDTSGNSNTTRIASTYKVRFGKTTAEGKIPYMIDGSDVIYLTDAADLDMIAEVFK
ncbi:MAG: DUF4340 domain-containing protein [Ruminococcaceae bacterium]|nr:DUF4340 domain-containing protein [Oscillospiraceae bacterium]